MLLCALLLCAFPASACLWDHDTLAMERQAFPQVLELITGKFLRHTPEFYQWRIQDRLQRLQSAPQDWALYDDLAVAYEKTGQTPKAIETLLKKEALQPGLYTTYANLGTFYLHQQEWAKGIEMIKKALRINPNAHFGREKYQLLLAEYYVSSEQRAQQADLKTHGLPLSIAPFEPDLDTPYQTFDGFLHQQGEKELAPALKGVMGMMHFGNYRSPVLLEVLGDLLLSEEHLHLATRAYLKAAYEAKDPKLAHKYRRLAEQAYLRVEHRDLPKLEAQFKQEIAEADKWFESLRQDEISWIQAGLNPESEFQKKYYQEPEVKVSGWLELRENLKALALLAGPVLFLLAIVGAPVYLLRKRRRQKQDIPNDNPDKS